jgi:Tfp pilus assembly protein PilN
VKAVNLIPGDSRSRRGAGPRAAAQGPTAALIGLLAVALAFVTIYVLTTNTISERKAKVASLQAETLQEQGIATRLANYVAFEKLAQTRAATVREIAAARFDWHAALSDLSKVVPADTSLQSLVGSVAPGAAISGAAGGSGTAGTLRGDITAPAFQLSGCTHSQDEVARLMSRLRLINGVTRVTLGDSMKQASSQAGTAVSSSGTAGGTSGCGANTPNFDLVVFFKPVPGAGPTGVAPATPAGTGVAATAATATAATSTTTAATTTTTTGGSK